MRLNFKKGFARICLIAISFMALALGSTQLALAAAPSEYLAAATPVTNDCKDTTTSDKLKSCVQNNQITKDMLLIVNVLSAGVGVVVIGMIILGGVQYTIAGDNAQAITAAKKRVINALLALFAFLFIFAFLQWIIPGGLFG